MDEKWHVSNEFKLIKFSLSIIKSSGSNIIQPLLIKISKDGVQLNCFKKTIFLFLTRYFFLQNNNGETIIEDYHLTFLSLDIPSAANRTSIMLIPHIHTAYYIYLILFFFSVNLITFFVKYFFQHSIHKIYIIFTFPQN